MLGALGVIMAKGVQNRDFSHAHIAKEYKSLQLDRNDTTHNVVINRNGDLVSFKGLTIYRQSDDTSLRIKSIHIIIGPQKIISIPYSILTAIGKVNNNNKITTISCDFSVFIREFHLICLGFHEIRVEVIVEDNTNIERIELPVEFVYYDAEERLEFARMGKIKTHMQNIETQEIPCMREGDVILNSQKFSERLDFRNVSKGLIIEAPIASIKNISIDFILANIINYFTYDEAMIRYIGRELSPNLLYIPFNANAELLSPNSSTFQAGVNFSRFDNITLTVETCDPRDSINVHSVTSNVLVTHNGMAELLYV